MTLDADLLARLRAVDTPTVCNAIETAQGRRGFDAVTRATLWASDPGAPAMVGYARTAQISGAAPAVDPPEAVRARRLDYYRAMAAGEGPRVAVVEDIDPHPFGAWWGEVNATVHRGLGLAGALTNGLMRDLGDLPEGFPIVAGGIGPSHGFVHVRAIGGEVRVAGLTVREGDLVHADRHGACVIPPEVLPGLAAAIDAVQAAEALILEPARRADFDIAKLETAWAAFEAARR